MHNYIVSRADQDQTQVALQAIHAALACPVVPSEDALVFLTVPDEATLIDLASQAECTLEPYRYAEDGKLNAVVFRRVAPDQRSYFQALQKWKL